MTAVSLAIGCLVHRDDAKGHSSFASVCRGGSRRAVEVPDADGQLGETREAADLALRDGFDAVGAGAGADAVDVGVDGAGEAR